MGGRGVLGMDQEKIENIKHNSDRDEKEQLKVKLLMMKKRASKKGPPR